MISVRPKTSLLFYNFKLKGYLETSGQQNKFFVSVSILSAPKIISLRRIAFGQKL